MTDERKPSWAVHGLTFVCLLSTFTTEQRQGGATLAICRDLSRGLGHHTCTGAPPTLHHSINQLHQPHRASLSAGQHSRDYLSSWTVAGTTEGRDGITRLGWGASYALNPHVNVNSMNAAAANGAQEHTTKLKRHQASDSWRARHATRHSSSSSDTPAAPRPSVLRPQQLTIHRIQIATKHYAEMRAGCLVRVRSTPALVHHDAIMAWLIAGRPNASC